MPLPREAPMADRVDAVVNYVQAPARHAVVDRAMSQAKSDELCPGHHTVLAGGERCYHLIDPTRGTSTPYIGADVKACAAERENRPASRAVFKVAPSGRAGVRAMKGPVSGSSGGRRRFDAASPEPMRPD
jgi:hypothetical protein